VSLVVVFDYGSGNLHSVVKALETSGASVTVSSQRQQAIDADGLVVPGVGAFSACMDQLRSAGGDDIIRTRVNNQAPLLGICVGHQVLFSTGVEHGTTCPGVGVYPGVVEKLPTSRLPHMGWNEVSGDLHSTFFPDTHRYYFVHSYGALSNEDIPDNALGLWCHHGGVPFLAAVEYGPVLSTQFHPEKSGEAGLDLLRTWVKSLEKS